MKALPEVAAEDTLYIADLNAYVHANFYVDAARAGMNFAHKIRRIVDTRAPGRILVAYDSEEPTFRDELYPDYKANRKATPEKHAKIREQLAIAQRAIGDGLGLATRTAVGFEADDVIATAALWGLEEGLRVVIIGRDKDLFQLVGPRCCIWDGSRPAVAGEEAVRERFGCEARQMGDYLAMVGDSGDNVPGVRNVGEKSAAEILWHFPTLEKALASAERYKPGAHDPSDPDDVFWATAGRGRMWSAMASGRASAERARRLVRLRTDAPLGIESLEELRP